MDKLMIVTGEERLKAEIDFLDGELKRFMRENKALKASLMTIASLDDSDDSIFAKKVADTVLEEFPYKDSNDNNN
jgi:hypothetical protein